MATTNMTFTEEDIETLVSNVVREQHKLKKGHEIATVVVVKRDANGENPNVTVEAEFDTAVEPKGSSKR